MELHEFLSVPYLLEAEAVEAAPGRWLIRLAYPELPGCTAEAAVVEDALRNLERRRIEIILGLLEIGEQPPVPRPPLATGDPLWTAHQFGLNARVETLLNSARRPSAKSL